MEWARTEQRGYQVKASCQTRASLLHIAPTQATQGFGSFDPLTVISTMAIVVDDAHSCYIETKVCAATSSTSPCTSKSVARRHHHDAFPISLFMCERKRLRDGWPDMCAHGYYITFIWFYIQLEINILMGIVSMSQFTSLLSVFPLKVTLYGVL